jgi:hypothetical protein
LNKKDARQHNQAICTPPPCGAVVFLAGEWSARRGTYRIRYRFDDKTVTVLTSGQDRPLITRDPIPSADGPSRLRAIPVLSELTGLPGLTEEDREELQPAASRLAAVIDRLAPLGITTRTGDAVALTPLGSALLRDALILGTAEADNTTSASFPTQDEVLSWDARQLADAAGNWPPAAARRVLCDWLAARGPAGWETLLPAQSAEPSDDIAPAQ